MSEENDEHHDEEGDGHHGPQIVVIHHKHHDEEIPHGSWKVAYADMVTALMAFFLLLWILSSTEKEILDGYSNYFTPTKITRSSTSGSGGIFGGDVADDFSDHRPAQHTEALSKFKRKKRVITSWLEQKGEDDETSSGADKTVDFKSPESDDNLNALETELAKTQLPKELEDLKEQIEVEKVNEGVRIRLIPDEGENGFFLNSARLKPQTAELLSELALRILNLPNHLEIHAFPDDSTPRVNRWKLAINRANTVLQALIESGLSKRRFKSVIGINTVLQNKINSLVLTGQNDSNANETVESRFNTSSGHKMRFDIILLNYATEQKDKKAFLPPSILEF